MLGCIIPLTTAMQTTCICRTVCRRKSDQSDPDWLVQLGLSRRVTAAHHAAEQHLAKANRAMRTLEEVFRALTHIVNVLPSASQVKGLSCEGSTCLMMNNTPWADSQHNRDLDTSPNDLSESAYLDSKLSVTTAQLVVINASVSQTVICSV